MKTVRHLKLSSIFLMFLLIGFTATSSGEPAFSDEQIQGIIQSYNGVTVKPYSSGVLLAEQSTSTGFVFKILIFNNHDTLSYAMSIPVNPGDPPVAAEKINDWNKDKIFSAYQKDNNIILQANMVLGQKKDSGPFIPDYFILSNYDLFARSSIEFINFIVARRNESKQQTSAKTPTGGTAPPASSIDALANGFLQSLQNAANVGSTEEIQRRINAGDYTVVDELNQAFKGMDQATQDFNRRAGITDEQARELQRESRCRDACAKEYSGCVASCPSGGNGHSCRHSCSSYKEACLIRCK